MPVSPGKTLLSSSTGQRPWLSIAPANTNDETMCVICANILSCWFWNETGERRKTFKKRQTPRILWGLRDFCCTAISTIFHWWPSCIVLGRPCDPISFKVKSGSVFKHVGNKVDLEVGVHTFIEPFAFPLGLISLCCLQLIIGDFFCGDGQAR